MSPIPTDDSRRERPARPVPPLARLAKGARAGLRAAALSVLGTLGRWDEGPFLRCVYCHYVPERQVAAFRRLLRELQARGRFVDTETCVAMVQGRAPIDGRYFHLSFDDGFRSIYDHAAPVLRELGIPAIVFVPSSVVGADSETVERYCFETVRLGEVVEVLDWRHVEELASWGVEVGSHTRTHARLSAVRDRATLEEEVAGSKREIEERTGRECRYFAWPFGTLSDVDGESIAVIRSAGYRACFGAFRGSARPGSAVDAFRIPRHHFEPHWPLAHVRYFAGGGGESRRA